MNPMNNEYHPPMTALEEHFESELSKEGIMPSNAQMLAEKARPMQKQPLTHESEFDHQVEQAMHLGV